MLAKRSPAIKKAVVELKRLSQDEEAQMFFEAREKERWIMFGRELQIALNFLKMGVPIEQVAEATELPVEIIEKYKSKTERVISDR